MEGDKLIILEGHIKVARHLINLILPQIMNTQSKFIITIAGESGSGKSEIATVFSKLFSENSIKSIILQQDDYFVYPPKTNDKMRRKNITHVGSSEVRLNLLDQNLQEIINDKPKIEKPVVIYDEDLITKETIKPEGIKVIIVDGTYTTLLKNVNMRIFIDRTYVDTREARKHRAREEQDAYLEKVLEIEHKIISLHKSKADIIITKDYEANENDRTKKQQN